MKLSLFDRTILIIIAVLLLANLFKQWKSPETVNAQQKYFLQKIEVDSQGYFDGHGQLAGFSCMANNKDSLCYGVWH
ncbi:MAG TPA: hypothetical protein VG649_00240 [Candidatus Angelobacter sp.]|jgi:hypothetical protein|nr:hypothetical protein [Candidatus Angelobacter sp.]